jgi:hypothetical protein
MDLIGRMFNSELLSIAEERESRFRLLFSETLLDDAGQHPSGGSTADWLFDGTGSGASTLSRVGARSSLQWTKRFEGRVMDSCSALFSFALCSLHDLFAGRIAIAVVDVPVRGRDGSLIETIAFDESDNLDKYDGHDIVLTKHCLSSGVFL